MIFCHDTIYAKVWKITKAEKYLDIQMSTSEKGQDGTYINSNWFPRVIGHAFNTLKDTLKEGDRICITKCKLSNERYTAEDGTTKSAFRFVILEANIEAPRNQGAAGDTNTTQAQAPAAQATPAANTTDNCPW